jgi:hypothetical protein
MTFTVGRAINEARVAARTDSKQVRYPDEKLFMKSRILPSHTSEVPLTKFLWIKEQWLAAGR